MLLVVSAMLVVAVCVSVYTNNSMTCWCNGEQYDLAHPVLAYIQNACCSQPTVQNTIIC